MKSRTERKILGNLLGGKSKGRKANMDEKLNGNSMDKGRKERKK